MRQLTRTELMTMYLYHDEYAKQAKGAIEFYKDLTNGQKATVIECVNELIRAKP